jgi:putative mycofactocin binding protein MftB
MSVVYYKLSPGTRVRKESFGLLFYNTKNTRLTFIDSGNLISVETLENESPEADFMGNDETNNRKIKGLLKNLVKRGLLLAEERSS